MTTTPCPRCHGNGEVAVPGTYGATVSPELLETVPCPTCHGEGVDGPRDYPHPTTH